MTSKKATRHRQILAELERQPSLRVGELAGRLGVSSETVRRDLDDLKSQGLVDRTYGGVTRRRSLEPSVSERHNLRVNEREAIAKTACPLLSGSSHLAIGSGATSVHLARRIAVEMKHVTVLAHSFGVATALSFNPTITVLMAPGIYHAGEGAVHGPATIRFLQNYNVDWAIFGASGITAEGPSDALIEAAEVYATMLGQASRRMIVADSSKFDQVFPARWAQWRDIDVLVCERSPGQSLEKAIEHERTEIRLASLKTL